MLQSKKGLINLFLIEAFFFKEQISTSLHPDIFEIYVKIGKVIHTITLSLQYVFY